MAAPSEPRQSVLVVFDFDWSLIEDNTDTWVTKLGGEETIQLQRRFGKEGCPHTCWTDQMDEIFGELHHKGISREGLESHMCSMVIHPDMEAACRLISSRPETDCFVLSDSNTVFIDTILRHYKLADIVQRVVTNPAEFDSQGRLHVQHCHQHSCCMCPQNLCKGHFLDQFRAAKKYDKVVYIGDGGGDVCPSLRLSDRDTVLARKDFTLFRKLTSAENLHATLVPWASATDVLQWFKDNLS